MLESAELVIRPWRQSAEDPRVWTRTVEDAAGRAQGFSRRELGRGLAALGWLVEPGLAVYESEDVSLLCYTAPKARLAARWKVFDADAHFVGSFRRARLRWTPDLVWLMRGDGEIGPGHGGFHGILAEDFLGRGLGLLRDGQGPSRRWIGVGGRELAQVLTGVGGVGVRFPTAADLDPFNRMILLSAVIQFVPGPERVAVTSSGPSDA